MNGKDFSPQSKVWIYQTSRPFTEIEAKEINGQLNIFTKQWTAHNLQLKAEGFLFENRVIVLMVDESLTNASGCSIDKAFGFIQELENKYKVELLNRMIVNYFNGNEWLTTGLHEINLLDENTLVIDPLVNNKFDFDSRFVAPLKNTWMLQYAS